MTLESEGSLGDAHNKGLVIGAALTIGFGIAAVGLLCCPALAVGGMAALAAQVSLSMVVSCFAAGLVTGNIIAGILGASCRSFFVEDPVNHAMADGVASFSLPNQIVRLLRGHAPIV